MGSNLSITDMLTKLEAKVTYHKEQEELHTSQESFHAEQKTVHHAEHKKALDRFEALKAAAAAAGEVLVDFKASGAAPESLPEDFYNGEWRWLSRLMSLVLDSKDPSETFSPSKIAKEIQERWGAKLRRRVSRRSVSATLCRWASTGRIRKIREGRAYYESLYTKQRLAMAAAGDKGRS